MGDERKRGSEEDLGEILAGIAGDAQKLLDQQLQLLRSEVRQEVREAKSAAASLGAGAGLVATGGVLSTLMLVHLLHRSTRAPLWCCYGIVGGMCGAIGAGLLRSGGQNLANRQLLPLAQTGEAIKENLTWLKEQTTPNQ